MSSVRIEQKSYELSPRDGFYRHTFHCTHCADGVRVQRSVGPELHGNFGLDKQSKDKS